MGSTIERQGDNSNNGQSEEAIAVVLDIENLLHPYREVGRLFDGLRALSTKIRELTASGVLIAGVAVCNPLLATLVSFALREMGIRTFRHNGGPNAADDVLLVKISELPQRVTKVVIASGDHIFTEAVTALQAQGRRVEVLGVKGHVARSLRLACDRVHLLRVNEPPIAA